MARLRSSVRSRGIPRESALVREAVDLYVATRAAWDDQQIMRLDWLLHRLSPRETDAYYDALQRWRQSEVVK